MTANKKEKSEIKKNLKKRRNIMNNKNKELFQYEFFFFESAREQTFGESAVCFTH